MKMVELMQCKVTLSRKKSERMQGIWNLETNKTLRSAIDECLTSGGEVFKISSGGTLYRVRPEYPLIESAMEKPENSKLLKVKVTAYLKWESLGVEL